MIDYLVLFLAPVLAFIVGGLFYLPRTVFVVVSLLVLGVLILLGVTHN
jgi:hypothetical protein